MHYREALHRMEELGADNSLVVRVNLALVLIARERYPEAEQILRDFLDAIDPSRVSINAIVHASLTPCAAAAKDWEAVDAHLAHAVRLAGRVGYVDTDLAEGFQRCAQICRQSGQYARAKQGLERSLEQWVALRRRDRVAEVRRALATL